MQLLTGFDLIAQGRCRAPGTMAIQVLTSGFVLAYRFRKNPARSG
jgi:hypothetical protein